MLVRHSFVYLLARGVPGVINFLSIALYTRVVTPEQYGQYIYILTTVLLFNAILFQWIRLGLLRLLPTYGKDKEHFFLTTIFAGYVGTVFFSLLLSLLAMLLHHNELLIICLVFLWIQAWFDINLELLRSKVSPFHYGLLSLSKSVLSVLFSILFIRMGLGSEALALGMIVGMLVPSLLVSRREWAKVHPKFFDKQLLLQIWHYGLPLTITLGMNVIINSSDRMMIGWLGTTADTGLYAAAYDLAQQTLIMLMMIVNLAAYPLVVRTLENSGIMSAVKQLEQNSVAILLISIPSVTGIMLFSANISGVLLGGAFRESASIILPWIAASTFLQGMKAYYLDLAFQLGKRTSLQIYPVLTAGIVSVTLNYLVIPKWGALGASCTSVISYFIALILSYFLGKKVFPIPFPVTQFLKIMAANLVMIVVTVPLHSHMGLLSLIEQVALGSVAYLFGVWLFNVANVRSKLIEFLEKTKKTKLKSGSVN